MDEKKAIRFLKASGLNLYESKVYHSLLRYGGISKSEIYKMAEIPQNRVYDIVNCLADKSLVREVESQTVVPEHPKEIVNSDTFQENKEKYLQRKKELEKKLESVTEKANFLTDFDKVFNHLRDIYNSPNVKHPIVKRFLSVFRNAKDQVLCCTTLPILYPSGQFYKEVLKAVDRGVDYKRILSYDYIAAQGRTSILEDYEKSIKIKAVPEEKIDEKYYVVDDSHVFLRAIKTTSETENEEAYIFNQDSVVDAYKREFRSLWEEAIKLNSFIEKVDESIEERDEGEREILKEVFNRGRVEKNTIFSLFPDKKNLIEKMVENKLLKNSEVKTLLIVNIGKLLENKSKIA